ncbi:hypothetical protein VAR608DRAFT_0628 [Variovorax sp. HW608]|uniref:hypothetical protein n=1 Tax=Variovorax sp. HW608 TaxID=1034889 RepID=UPI00081F75B5|nr:hypothetical protein [Variovorax sp. HW608]SCK11806.1 hypothetical protein VAR608DRAFT_0628 [Variovorax sp. HW608]
MQLVTSANSIWPSAAPSVAYAQLGDLVEMLLHPKDSVFATCGFCQTLNRRGATRCRACGGSLLPSDEGAGLDRDEADDEQSGEKAATHTKSSDKPEFSDLQALRSVLLLVLVPPLLMFLAFVAWNRLRVSDAGPVGLPDRSSIETVFPAPNASASIAPPATPQDEQVRRAQPKPAATGAVPDGTDVVATEADRDIQKATPARPRAVPGAVPSHPAPHIRQGSPIAACGSYSFIARAVCVNKNCAQPGAAQHAECRQANRQRRIDESRRNPVLMG